MHSKMRTCEHGMFAAVSAACMLVLVVHSCNLLYFTPSLHGALTLNPHSPSRRWRRCCLPDTTYASAGM